MKKLFTLSLLALLLTACQKNDVPAVADTAAAPATAPAASTNTTEHSEHDGHEHAEHDDHDHAHDAGDAYTCDGGKQIKIGVHTYEGELEAHATIDDIVYDLHPDTTAANQYISHEDGINGQGMLLNLTDNQAVFTSLADKTVLLSCQK